MKSRTLPLSQTSPAADVSHHAHHTHGKAPPFGPPVPWRPGPERKSAPSALVPSPTSQSPRPTCGPATAPPRSSSHLRGGKNAFSPNRLPLGVLNAFYERPPCGTACPPSVRLVSLVSLLVSVLTGHCVRLVSLLSPFVSGLVLVTVSGLSPFCLLLSPFLLVIVSLSPVLSPFLVMCPPCLPSTSFCLSF